MSDTLEMFRRATESQDARLVQALRDGYRMWTFWGEQPQKGDDLMFFGMLPFWRPSRERKKKI